MKMRKQITQELAGAPKLEMVASFEAVQEACSQPLPVSAPTQGSINAWSWSWVNDEGVIVAASNHVEAPPFGRHGLAIRSLVEDKEAAT